MNTNKEKKLPVENSEMVELTVNGMTMSTMLTKKFKNRRMWSKPDKKHISSFIPGTIRDVFVKAGDQVQENDKLLILEAMKMMNVITSPVDGKISQVLVTLGEKIPKGKIMVEFEQGEKK